MLLTQIRVEAISCWWWGVWTRVTIKLREEEQERVRALLFPPSLLGDP